MPARPVARSHPDPSLPMSSWIPSHLFLLIFLPSLRSDFHPAVSLRNGGEGGGSEAAFAPPFPFVVEPRGRIHPASS